MLDEDNSCNWHGANTTADVVNAYCVHNGRLGALCPILVYSQSFYEQKAVYQWPGDEFKEYGVSASKATHNI